MLEADVEFWWMGARRMSEGAQTLITLEVFKTIFCKKYFPASVRNVKELMIMRLQQGNMSVLKYIAKFKELSKFSTIHQHNLDKGWKCIKFEGSLREDIFTSMQPMEIRDYAALVNKSILMEEYNKKLVAAKLVGDASKKRLAT